MALTPRIPPLETSTSVNVTTFDFPSVVTFNISLYQEKGATAQCNITRETYRSDADANPEIIGAASIGIIGLDQAELAAIPQADVFLSGLITALLTKWTPQAPAL